MGLTMEVYAHSIIFGSDLPKSVSAEISADISAEISAETEISVNTTEIHISVNKK